MTPGGNRIGDFDFSTALEIIPHPSTARPTERRSGGRSKSETAPSTALGAR